MHSTGSTTHQSCGMRDGKMGDGLVELKEMHYGLNNRFRLLACLAWPDGCCVLARALARFLDTPPLAFSKPIFF